MARGVIRSEIRQLRIILTRDRQEGRWITCVPALNHLSDWGKTRQEAIERTREAISGYLEALKKEGLPLLGDSI